MAKRNPEIRPMVVHYLCESCTEPATEGCFWCGGFFCATCYAEHGELARQDEIAEEMARAPRSER